MSVIVSVMTHQWWHLSDDVKHYTAICQWLHVSNDSVDISV